MTSNNRTSIPGTKSGSTDSISVAEFNDLGGALVSYATPLTSTQGSITSAADITGLSVTLTTGTSRNYQIKVTLAMATASLTGQFQVALLKDGTQVQRRDFTYAPVSVSANLGAELTYVDHNPTAASHTYKVQAGRSGSDGNTWTMFAASTEPATLEVFDVGPHF
jgi:hypothetical protein